ncbi:MAG: hypothetical protein UW76_C0017G0019 [Parcubacteria group bacterium GW2011_GWF2_44_8b]|nr:hypothetical protein [uncultured bacterium]KKT15196.1 MAG: hypothetical protein UV94_C0002G0023 [Parcubacteria group bacterium GW2011_GWC1_43_30]KKT80045.1 MAG: hypothetical protein UW76_C0017G0019 [Parcubacteria group bacterium GW2011_GWF2_44_8b]KKT85952.1 MAG: hypothetical protein UW83_C0005G0012 [Parcubacteria group bacterium GW2011_GWD1_44_9]
MYKVVAIMTQPYQVFYFVITSVFVYMMNGEYSDIFSFTQSTFLRNFSSAQQTPIRKLTICVVSMFGSTKLSIAPSCLAALGTKPFSTFRNSQSL